MPTGGGKYETLGCGLGTEVDFVSGVACGDGTC